MSAALGRSRRACAQTAQSRSPAPVSDVRRSLSAPPKAGAPANSLRELAHAPGVVGARPTNVQTKRPPRLEHPRDLGERRPRAGSARRAADDVVERAVRRAARGVAVEATSSSGGTSKWSSRPPPRSSTRRRSPGRCRDRAAPRPLPRRASVGGHPRGSAARILRQYRGVPVPSSRAPSLSALVDARLSVAPYEFAAAARLAAELGLLARARPGAGAARARRPGGGARVPGGGRRAPARGLARAGRGRRGTILEHVERGSRITVHGDYDVDGVCSTAILVRALRTLGADVDWYLPSRIDDGYGLARATVERLAARGTQPADHRRLRGHRGRGGRGARARSGMDVVVTDHHSPARRRRSCRTRRSSTRGSTATRARTCARRASRTSSRRRCWRRAGEDPALADEDLDLVALATVADVVPLQGENRRLVRAGLRALAGTRKVGLRALMDVARVDPSGLDESRDRLPARPAAERRRPPVPRRRGPRAAAHRGPRPRAGRRRRARRGQRRAPRRRDPDPLRGRGAGRRASRGQRARARRRGLAPGRDRHRRLADRRAPPPPGDPDRARRRGGHAAPAARSRRFDLLGGLHASAGHLLRYGGHKAAAGLTIAAAEVDAFRAAFLEHANAVLTDEDLVPAGPDRRRRPGRRAVARPRRGAPAARPVRHGQPGRLAARPGRAR